MIFHYDSPIGVLTISYDGALNGLWTLANVPAALEAEAPTAALSPTGCNPATSSVTVRSTAGSTPPTTNSSGAEPVVTWLDAYFAGQNPAIDFPIEQTGTPFQLASWQALREIPYGETVSYGELAAAVGKKLGRPTSARAVGGAVGRNQVLIAVPCHRVIGADGSMAGYAGGLECKIQLLDLERA